MTPRLFPLLLLALPALAHADLGGQRHGFWGDVGGGLGVADRPWHAGVGWTIAVGGWLGKYDDSFAIGRRIDLGVRVRQDVLVDGVGGLRTAPMLEVRRGIDLLVVAIRVGGSAGPLLVRTLDDPRHFDVGGTVRANAAVGWRFRPAASLQLRLEAGIDVLGRHVDPVLATTLGIEVALPSGRRQR